MDAFFTPLHSNDLLVRLAQRLSSDLCEELLHATKQKVSTSEIPLPKSTSMPSSSASKQQTTSTPPSNTKATTPFAAFYVGGCNSTTASDIITFNDAYHVYVDLPGIEKSQLNINFEDNVLSISGTRRAPYEMATSANLESKSNGLNSVLRSITYGNISYEVELPDDVDTASITASYTNGMLHVLLKRLAKQPAKATRISVL